MKFGEPLQEGDVWGHPDRGFRRPLPPPDAPKYEAGMENDSDRDWWYRPDESSDLSDLHQSENSHMVHDMRAALFEKLQRNGCPPTGLHMAKSPGEALGLELAKVPVLMGGVNDIPANPATAEECEQRLKEIEDQIEADTGVRPIRGDPNGERIGVTFAEALKDMLDGRKGRVIVDGQEIEPGTKSDE